MIRKGVTVVEQQGALSPHRAVHTVYSLSSSSEGTWS